MSPRVDRTHLEGCIHMSTEPKHKKPTKSEKNMKKTTRHQDFAGSSACIYDHRLALGLRGAPHGELYMVFCFNPTVHESDRAA